MVGAFAAFERAMNRERTSARMAAARTQGRVGGWRKKLYPAERRGAPLHRQPTDRLKRGRSGAAGEYSQQDRLEPSLLGHIPAARGTSSIATPTMLLANSFH